ncbi:MAG: antibiotic biosynthesis monooxygenase [Candidatus Heimdallarchaeota archaeon]
MIARIWHGWTSFENADLYEDLLRNEIFPSIVDRNIKGYRKISLLRRQLENEIEFITIMIFDDLSAVKEFVGEQYERSYVPQKAKDVLLKYDKFSQHYEIIDEFKY